MDHGAPLGAWGEAPSGRVLDPRAEAFARARLGEPLGAPGPGETAGGVTERSAAEDSALTPERMRALFPGVEWSLEASLRARFSRGMSYLNLMSWRAGEAARLPDAVVFPTSHQDVLDVLAACSAQGIAVVPVGGGTSVTGGVDTPDLDTVVVCSLDRMSEVQNLDTESGIVTVQAGATGPQLESYLNERGWTLGHFPQSFERATIGGYIATRSSGQSSSGYGRIEDLLVGAEVASPVGTLSVGGYPASATGPDLRHVVLGSEGALGIVTSADLRVRAFPTFREYSAAIVPGDFSAAANVVRALTRSPLRPTIVRASDEAETRALLTMSGPGGVLGGAFSMYMRMRRALPGSLIILGWESESATTLGAMRAFARERLADAGAVSIGGRPGRSWVASRFLGPYQRDAMMDAGYLVETFETVVVWSAMDDTHHSLADVVRAQLGDDSYVMAHISHSYEVGASLYFTVLAGARSDPRASMDRWRSAKAAIMDALAECGAAVSHHHGVGRDHRDFLPAAIGPVGEDVLRAVKTTLDPGWIMNPGALVTRPDGQR